MILPGMGLPRFDSFDDLNARLEEQCLKRQDEVIARSF